MNITRQIGLFASIAFALLMLSIANTAFASSKAPTKIINDSLHNYISTLSKSPLVYDKKQTPLKTARKQSKASSAAHAAQIAQEQYGGKVLKIETKNTKDGVIYRIKLLLEDGRVKTVVING